MADNDSAPGQARTLIENIGSRWEYWLDLLAVLRPMRFPIIVLAAGAALLLLIQQAQDALYVLVASVSDCTELGPGACRRAAGRFLVFVACWFFWAFNTFYAARFMSRLPPTGRLAYLEALASSGTDSAFHIYPPPRLQKQAADDLALWLPRVLGVFVVLAVYAALQIASWKAGVTARLLVAGVSLVMLGLIGAIVILRRPALRRGARLFSIEMHVRPGRDMANGHIVPRRERRLLMATAALLLLCFLPSAWFDLGTGSSLPGRTIITVGALGCLVVSLAVLRAWNGIPPATKWFVGVLTTVSMALFIASLWPTAPQVTALFGSPAVVVLAAAGWASAGTFLIAFPAEISGFPILTVLLVLAIGFSAVGSRDNHLIRTAPTDARADVVGGALSRAFPVTASACPALTRPRAASDQPSPFAQNDDFARAYDRWCTVAKAQWRRPGPVPLVIVATAGGASRAAYWTMVVLGTLEERIPGFHNYVFAISSVSGGTLGAAAYRLSLDLPSAPNCLEDDNDRQQTKLLGLLKQDFLSSLLLGAAYSDLVQRILPGSLLPDRAAALEAAWESGWAEQFSHPGCRHWMADPFLARMNAFWARPDQWRPIMLFNGTSQTSGQRIITSNMPIGWTFPGAFDFHDMTGTDVPVSTAAHNSARFPYLDAGGNIRNRNGTLIDRIIDGGYFENNGAATAVDLLDQLIDRGAVGLEGSVAAVTPIVIQITNDPEAPVILPLGQRFPEPRKSLSAGWRTIADATVPPLGFYDTRDGLGERATEALRRRLAFIDPQVIDDSRYFHFGIGDPRVPMSWLLSDDASGMIDAELPLDTAAALPPAPSPSLNDCVKQSNRRQFDTLSARLSGRPAAIAPPDPRCGE